ncbi:MAG: zinc ribbon domain-containing protein [Deltaproteobacteria bacterium]|nr:zinc ribbon domain-containing protein [Deltaproteobacteria bacterium]
MECIRCHHENAVHRRFCGRCGHLLSIACPRCGFGNQKADVYCGGCGDILGADQPPVRLAASQAAVKAQVSSPSRAAPGLKPLPRQRTAIPPPQPPETINLAPTTTPTPDGSTTSPIADELDGLLVFSPRTILPSDVTQEDIDRLFG